LPDVVRPITVLYCNAPILNIRFKERVKDHIGGNTFGFIPTSHGAAVPKVTILFLLFMWMKE